MALLEGRLRIEVLPTAITLRVMTENGVAGVEDALDNIEQFVAEMAAKGIAHKVHLRKYHTGYRADTVVVMTQMCSEPRCAAGIG
jgi:hypothetical protein